MGNNKLNNERRKSGNVFLVLAPHRDTRILTRKFSDTLIKAGLTGVYTFPWVAPLAFLSQPLCDEELKKCARALRDKIGSEKIHSVKTSTTKFPAEDMTLFGHCLDLAVTNKELGQAALKTKSIFSPLVIGAFLYPACYSELIHNSSENQKPLQSSAFEKLEFRAAAVANMFWRPFKNGDQKCFKWKIGKLFWLPRQEKK